MNLIIYLNFIKNIKLNGDWGLGIGRTKNKKYYKRFNIPDLERLNIKLDESLMKVNFVNSTLIISYTKPKEILEAENEILEEIRKVRAEIKKNPNAKYDPGCQHQ